MTHHHRPPSSELSTAETNGNPEWKPAGVNLIGYLKAESGVGEIGRLIAKTLEAAGIPYSLFPFSQTRSRQEHPFCIERSKTRQPFHEINVVCINADQLPLFAATAGAPLLNGRYTIGVWAWEVEDFPAWMSESAGLVDEIWGISHHTASVLTPHVTPRVRAFPLPIQVPSSREQTTRPSVYPDDRFVFAFSFDFDSVFERKNPVGLVEAFRRAFEPDEGPVLVIKSINGDLHPRASKRLRRAVAGRPDIRLVDGYLSSSDQLALMVHCDAYVSLHRAEGFGLTMAEAMAVGKPVIATAYSANLDFMTEGNSHLVPFRYTSIPRGCDPYTPGTRWADPDLGAAARLMRQVWENPDEAKAVGERARQDIATRHSPQARARTLTRLLQAVDPKTKSSGTLKNPRYRTAAETAVETLLARGPDISRPSRFGAITRWLRRSVQRLNRNYSLHQQAIQHALLHAVRERDHLLREDLARELGRLDHRLYMQQLEIRQLTETVTELRESLAALTDDGADGWDDSEDLASTEGSTRTPSARRLAKAHRD